jgi:hypothetical protein
MTKKSDKKRNGTSTQKKNQPPRKLRPVAT